jgi:methyl-accepting chemotaxis protein WspA
MRRISDYSIRAKLYGLVAFSTIGVAAVLALAGWLLAEFRVNGPVYERIIRREDALGEFRPAALYIIWPYTIAGQLKAETDPAEARRLIDRFRKQEEVYNQRRDYWLARLGEGPTKEGLSGPIHQPAAEFFRIADQEFLPLVEKGQVKEAARVFTEKLQPRFEEHRAAVERTTETGRQTTAAEEAEVRDRLRFWMGFMVVIGVFTVAAVGLLGAYLAQGILRSTATLIDRVNEMASGASDLTARVAVDSQDEIGTLAQGINAMISKIQSVVRRVRESCLQVLATASEIAATSRQQEATVQGLGSSTTQIAAAVREISATSQELSGTMNEVNGRADQAASLAAAGRTRLAGMEAAMQQLVDSTASISSKLAMIREKADNINVVVTTITKVADQTNLLSINAAIEAEKAGEYGRGFLVVAREIRRLADQTAVATLDIENMVRHMHDAVSAGVMQMDKFTEEVRTGVSRVAELNGQTGQIIEEVRGLSDRFRLVNEGMRNQSTGAAQINEAMVQMTDSTRQTATSLEEFNKATAHLRNSVELLNQEIAQFTV